MVVVLVVVVVGGGVGDPFFSSSYIIYLWQYYYLSVTILLCYKDISKYIWCIRTVVFHSENGGVWKNTGLEALLKGPVLFFLLYRYLWELKKVMEHWCSTVKMIKHLFAEGWPAFKKKKKKVDVRLGGQKICMLNETQNKGREPAGISSKSWFNKFSFE